MYADDAPRICRDDALSIVPLKRCVDAIPTLAAWHHGEWGDHNREKDEARRIELFEQEHIASDSLPQTWVATWDGSVCGSFGLDEEDLLSRPQLSPWLVSVYVEPTYRGKGIGGALVERALLEAEHRGIDRLWLFTPDRAAFYERLGWNIEETTSFLGEVVRVMSINPRRRTRAH